LRELWPLLNRTHHVDGVVVRIACLLLLIIFLVSSIIRHIPDPAMLAIRVAVVAYTAIGIAVGPRFAWPSLRLYTVGMALVLPSCTAALEILRGNHPADLAITAISIFGPMPFLQTGVDVLVVSAALLSYHRLVTTLGPPGADRVAGVVSCRVVGAATALVLIAFRAASAKVLTCGRKRGRSGRCASSSSWRRRTSASSSWRASLPPAFAAPSTLGIAPSSYTTRGPQPRALPRRLVRRPPPRRRRARVRRGCRRFSLAWAIVSPWCASS
jgi:hypothetical protein